MNVLVAKQTHFEKVLGKLMKDDNQPSSMCNCVGPCPGSISTQKEETILVAFYS